MHKLILAMLMILMATLSHGQTCNPNIVRSTPDSRYKLLNNDSEVKDTLTGLIWGRCSLGQTWSGTSCTGTAATYTWRSALDMAKGMGNGWRVPNIKELESIAEEACYSAAINEAFFPATQTGTFYWSSSPVINNSYAWTIYFGNGGINYNYKDYSLYVRLVRSSK